MGAPAGFARRGERARALSWDQGKSLGGECRPDSETLAAALPPLYGVATMTTMPSPPSVRALDEPKLEALIETMFLAAFADGDFGGEERKQLIAAVESLTDRALSTATTDALLTRIQAELARSGRAARLGAVKAQLTSPGERKTALSLAIRLVASDGIIRTSERELILDVAEALEIDRDEAADLVREIAG